MRAVSILYHDVVRFGAFDSSGFLIPGADRYKLDSDEFARHLDAIAGVIRSKPIILTEHSAKSQDEQFLITFDDGGVSCHSIIADMLEHHSWRGHFFITTDFIDTARFLSRQQIRELRKRGHVIGSHSCSYPAQISRCSPLQLKKEWTDSVKKLEDILGEPIKMASVPGGFYSIQVADWAFVSGIRTLFTSEPTTKCRQVNGLFVLGRYGIRRGMSPRAAAGLVAGNWRFRFEQLLRWKTTGFLKAVGGEQYAKLRKAVLNRTSG